MRHLVHIVRAALVVAAAGIVIVTLRPSDAPETAASAATASPGSTQPATPQRSGLSASQAFAMTMSDADLTQAAAASFPQTVSGVTLSDPVVHIQTDGVRLTATAKVLFGTTEFALLATPSASDGKVTVRVDAATLAGVSLPDSTRASIAQTLQSTISRLIPSDARVTSVRLAAGQLSVEGTRP